MLHGLQSASAFLHAKCSVQAGDSSAAAAWAKAAGSSGGDASSAVALSVPRVYNRFAKFTTIADATPLWRAAAEELAEYAAVVRKALTCVQTFILFCGSAIFASVPAMTGEGALVIRVLRSALKSGWLLCIASPPFPEGHTFSHALLSSYNKANGEEAPEGAEALLVNSIQHEATSCCLAGSRRWSSQRTWRWRRHTCFAHCRCAGLPM